MTTSHPRPRPTAPRVPARPAFTILEVMLASMLGLLVVLTAIGLFGSMRISSARSEATYERRMELALTQEAIERATRSFIMSNLSAPRPQPSSTPVRSNRTAGADEGAVATEPPPPPAGRARVILEPDPRFSDSMRWDDGAGNVRLLTPQRLEVTLTRPPVFAPPTIEDLIEASYEAREDAVALSQRRSRRTDDARSERRSSRERAGRAGSSASSADAANGDDSGARSSGSRRSSRRGGDRESTIIDDLSRRAGIDPAALRGAEALSGDAAQDPAQGAQDIAEQTAEEEDGETALAPGVRGVFELQWDPDDLSRPAFGAEPNPDGGTWSLWWRLIDSDEVDILTELGTEAAALSQEQRRAMLESRLGPDAPRRGMVRLASKLVSCRWEVVRSGETLSDFAAFYQDELPAYFAVELQTLSGHWMKWMFEVDWTRGEEPGSPIGVDEHTAGSIPVLGDLPVIGNQFRNPGSGAGPGQNNRGGTQPDLDSRGGRR